MTRYQRQYQEALAGLESARARRGGGGQLDGVQIAKEIYDATTPLAFGDRVHYASDAVIHPGFRTNGPNT